MQFSDSQNEYLWNEVFPSLPFLDSFYPLPIRELLYLFQIVGSMHASQDVTVFSWESPNVISPFMDVDFLEHVLSSPYSSQSEEKKNNTKGSSSRVNFICQLTHLLAPELSHIHYAKWGGYSAWELLHYPKTFKLKRIIRHLVKKDHYISNFSYENWFYPFCREELSNLHPEINSFYNMKPLLQKLDKKFILKTEREWHFATNPINLSMNLRLFLGK